MIHMESVTYKCRQCGAEDTLRVEVGEPAWPALNCWKCKAGFSGMNAKNFKSHEDMVRLQIGMFPMHRGQDTPRMGSLTEDS